MNKQQFLQKFAFHHLDELSSSYQHVGDLKHASVLIPIVDHGNELSIVLTKRASHLKHHAGQISFPGGKVEKQDIHLIDTALRETEEEIGVNRDEIKIVGQLKPYHTITGFHITPIIGFIPDNYNFVIDQNEVAEVFYVPFSHFFDEDNHLKVEFSRQGNKHKVYFMPYLNYNIWGATAAILKDLVQHLK
ncbi:CoA pyrophosphatase [Thalassotalea crassostreae]|uniref:CoA pyrophosphatase n=1 Tax=Thalassotalea crassostreae TaxID=1763536 RepID=UPI000837C474|nr:CoA pyrophosphatase [Thalassotalea crassostreae]